MDFYFCGKFIHTNGDEKEVERDMYAALPYFQSSNDHYGYEKWENNLKDFFSYFVDIWAEVLLCSNEAGWTALVVER